jgi:hypothetical protein
MSFNIFSLKPWQIFLIDGMGALLSAALIWLVYYYQNIFGVPATMFQQLICFPLLFACYSFTCMFMKPRNWKIFLGLIVVLNFLYCLFSIALLTGFLNTLKVPGVVYFLLEIVVIFGVVALELAFIKMGSTK